MNIKLIGTGAIYTKYNSACTLIDNKIIVDMPNGTLKQLLKQGLDCKEIKTIVITHKHGDHTADIPFFLKHICAYYKENYKITIIGPLGIRKKIIELFNAYIMHKMIHGEISEEKVMKNVFQEISEDETVIRLTVDDIKEKPNFIKRILIKILG